MKNIFIALLFITAHVVKAQPYPEVKIAGSEIRNIKSTIVSGQEYELQIALPSGYATSTKTYPVVYLMDSQWDFSLVSAIYGEQYYDGFVPEFILVGVTWANGDVLRNRDYVPNFTASHAEKVGGADAFLDFMKIELFPFIEKNYRVEPQNRTLMGCSLGGLFTLYTLFTHSDMFTGYIAASPALNWNNGGLYTLEEEFSKKEVSTPKQVFLTMGDVENGTPNFKEFVNKMKASAYKNVRFQSKVLENTGHSGTKSETYSRGLQYVFERNKLKLEDAILNKYTGTYKFGNGGELSVKNEDNNLYLYTSPQDKILLFAHSETQFYATFQFFNVTFKEVNGAVQGFDLKTYDFAQTFEKSK